MGSLAGVNHITFLTSDLDRLVGFYQEVFGAHKLMELPVPEPEGPGRHALITLGAGATLHPFELSRTQPPAASPMFQRGRIDHFALNVADTDTFAQLRDELLARGLTDGDVTDFGVLRVLTFIDPDGHSVELAQWVGTTDPEELDMTRATDEEIIAHRAAATIHPD
jgi:catechol 2,3-dioxygenase-like lactoylglutathione lyase family enzyme